MGHCGPFINGRIVNGTKGLKDLSMPTLIMKKREGLKLSSSEIEHFVREVVEGDVQEAQIGKSLFSLRHYMLARLLSQHSALLPSIL